MATFNDNPAEIIAGLIVSALFVYFGTIAWRRPDIVIRYLGRIGRNYTQSTDMSEKQANRMVLPGFEDMFDGSVQVFFEKAETDPQRFRSLTTYIRLFGLVFIPHSAPMNRPNNSFQPAVQTGG